MDPLLLFGGGGVIVFARESEALSLIWIFQGYAQWVGGLDPRPTPHPPLDPRMHYVNLKQISLWLLISGT